MQHLTILGSSDGQGPLTAALRKAGFSVTLLPEPIDAAGTREAPEVPTWPSLLLIEASDPGELERLAPTARGSGLPWLVLCKEPPTGAGADPYELTAAAYQAGALAVLPGGSPSELVVQAIQRAFDSWNPTQGLGWAPKRRVYRAGDAIPLKVDELLRVVVGVVAHRVWHEDGAEGLVGLWGPGHLIAGHPDDGCCLSLRAHTEAVVEVSATASRDRLPWAETFDRLLERIRCLEAWSAVQSRQNMEQRLLGVLTLLAEQFGEERAEGTVIDVRVTHAQLAAAIGANRATVTRLLGPLRRRGRISTVAAENGERFCLPCWRGISGHGEAPLARARCL